MDPKKYLVAVRGGGDIATGVISRLAHSGFHAVILETPEPTVIRRTVSLASAVYSGTAEVEGITAKKVNDIDGVWNGINSNVVPVLIDPLAATLSELKPYIVVDAILAKRNIGTNIKMAPIVIGLGPGFCAGDDVHAVIETNRGHNLGRVYYEGSAEPNTGIPGNICGFGNERVIRAPAEGIVKNVKDICSIVKRGEIVAYIGDTPATSNLDGVLRGLIMDGLKVEKNFKIGDVDPRCIIDHCYSISDKARAIGGGVLEAILYFLSKQVDLKYF
jgi:xanthine dehydrogenase accessory factor